MSTEAVNYQIGLKDKISGGLDSIYKKADKTDKKIDDIGKTSKKTADKSGSSFAGLGGIIGGLGLVAGFGLLAKSVVGAGVNMEQTRVSFEVLTGSAEKGNAILGKLNNFANVTPFDNNQVIKAGQGLTAFGITSEQLIPTLSAIGDIASGTGKDFNELSTIYGKARVSGTLYAEDINQLVEAGIPVMGEFAKALGTTEDNVKKMASEGKLKFADLQTAFSNLTSEGGQFYKMNEKQSQTLAGQWSSMVGMFQVVGVGIGESFIEPLKNVLGFFNRFVEFVKGNADGFSKILAPIKEAFKPLIETLSNLWAKVSAVTSEAGFFESVFNKIGLAIEIISPIISGFVQILSALINVVVEVATAFYNWYQQSETAQMLFRGFIASVVAGFTFLKVAVVNTLGGIGDLLVGIFTFDAGRINEGLKKVVNNFDGAGSASADAFNKSYDAKEKNNFTKKEVVAGVTGPTKTLADFISDKPIDRGDKKKGGKGKKEAGSSVDGVASGRPQNVVINITKLVEKLEINSATLSQSEAEIKSLISRALVSAVNDVNLAFG